MRRATVDDTKQVESAIFDVNKALNLYFNDVIPIEGFILTVDETGAYFFTTMEDQNLILVKLSNYVEQLALAGNELTVCRITWDADCVSDEVYFKQIPDTRFKNLQIIDINPDSFEQSLRLLLSNRDPVFSKLEVAEIVECFKPAALMEGSLYQFLLQRGFSIDRAIATEYENHPVITLQDVMNDFGSDNAEGLLNAMLDYREMYQNSMLDMVIDLTKYHQKRGLDQAANLAAIMGIVSMVLSIVFSVVRIPELALAFSVIAFLQARHLALIYKNVVATIITWFSVVIIVFSTIQMLAFIKPDVIQWLQENLLISR